MVCQTFLVMNIPAKGVLVKCFVFFNVKTSVSEEMFSFLDCVNFCQEAFPGCG